MSAIDENTKEQLSENQENVEEEEQLDEETSKALKNLRVDDSAFTNDEKHSKNDKKSKQTKVFFINSRNQNKKDKTS